MVKTLRDIFTDTTTRFIAFAYLLIWGTGFVLITKSVAIHGGEFQHFLILLIPLAWVAVPGAILYYGTMAYEAMYIKDPLGNVWSEVLAPICAISALFFALAPFLCLSYFCDLT